jgi:hypothetical protein
VQGYIIIGVQLIKSPTKKKKRIKFQIKNYSIWLGVVFLLLGLIFAGSNSSSDLFSQQVITLPDTIAGAGEAVNFHSLDRVIPNNAFGVGEKLSFVIRYGFIHAGDAIMEVSKLETVKNHLTYHIITTARSKKTFDFFFKVRDSVQTWVDSQGLYSWRFNKKLREGAYKFDLLVNYNQYMGTADVEMIRYHDDEPLRIREKENFSLNIPPYVLDILSTFYFVRTQQLEVGMPLYITNHDNKKIYNLKVYVQRKEIVEVKAGKFQTIMVQPALKGDAIFKQQGKLWVWLTDDQYKIPVQMKSAAFIGKITTELTNIEGVPLPLTSQID